MIDIFFFAAETPAKKNAHALWAGPVIYKEPTRSVRSFPFLSSQQKREKTNSSAISASSPRRYLRGWAVRYRFAQVIIKRDINPPRINVKILGYVDF
jgi:hypothetical protein